MVIDVINDLNHLFSRQYVLSIILCKCKIYCQKFNKWSSKSSKTGKFFMKHLKNRIVTTRKVRMIKFFTAPFNDAVLHMLEKFVVSQMYGWRKAKKTSRPSSEWFVGLLWSRLKITSWLIGFIWLVTRYFWKETWGFHHIRPEDAFLAKNGSKIWQLKKETIHKYMLYSNSVPIGKSYDQ